MLANRGQKLDSVVNFNIADSVLIPRVTGRLIHPASGRSYHRMFAPPKVDGKDDITGEALIQRPDDNETTITTRLNAFHTQTQPVVDYYKSKALLRDIDADQPFATVYSQITKALQK